MALLTATKPWFRSWFDTDQAPGYFYLLFIYSFIYLLIDIYLFIIYKYYKFCRYIKKKYKHDKIRITDKTGRILDRYI